MTAWLAKFAGGLVVAVIILLGLAADCGLDDLPAVRRCGQTAESGVIYETWMDTAADFDIPQPVARQAWADGERGFRASAWTLCLEGAGFKCSGDVDLDGLSAAKTCQRPDDGGGTVVVDNPYLLRKRVHDATDSPSSLNSPHGPARAPRRPEPRPAPRIVL